MPPIFTRVQQPAMDRVVTARFTGEEAQALDRMAKARGISRSELVRLAICEMTAAEAAVALPGHSVLAGVAQ